MSTEFALPVTPEPPAPTRGQRVGLRSSRSWAELLYAVLDLAPSIAFFVAIVTLLAVGTGLAIIYVGVPILALGLLVARLGGLVQRSLALALLDLPGSSPGWTQPRRPGPVSALGALLRDSASWRAVAYFMIKIALAPVTFAVAVGFYGYGSAAVTCWLWRPFLSERAASDVSLFPQWWPGSPISGWLSTAVLTVVGAAVLWCAPRVVGFMTTVDRVLIGTLLTGTGGRPEPPAPW